MSGLPKGWVQARLGEICDFNPKHEPETDRATTVSFIPMPAVDDETGAIVDRSASRPLSEVWKGYTHFADADVIFAKITPCMENGKIAVARDLENGLACGSTEFHVLRSQGAVEPDFIWRFLRQQSYRQVAERSMTGAVGQRRVPKTFLEATVLPLPPLAEQKRIVAKLEALNAKSASARTALARIETLVSRYKQAVLSKAFSGELTNGDTSTDWHTVRLEEIAEIGTGATPKRGNAEYYSNGTIPWITSGAVNEGLILQADEFITERAIQETNCKIFPAGTLVVAMYGEGKTRGKVAILGLDAATNQALAAVRIRSSEVSAPQYVYLFLQSVYLTLREEAAGGVQPNLNLSIVKAIELPLPLLEEQHEIVRRIESAFAKIDRLAAEAKRALALVGRLDEAVLAKAFRGELVPQDENDEPAATLLARIRAEREAAPKVKRGRKARS
ncbi:restriction endonuclease subunit S [Pannonibacter phragmitetus]|uniref:restriction endonuclease subunit S n=1 Tax=Pannonibacter phragmitetus TaxID=121719 RepID=UPI000F01BE81|nr:restriction endonuclease subunit S [Pannonibacter phragmitetus]